MSKTTPKTILELTDNEAVALLELLWETIREFKTSGSEGYLNKHVVVVLDKLNSKMNKNEISIPGFFQLEIKEEDLLENWFLAPFKADIN